MAVGTGDDCYSRVCFSVVYTFSAVIADGIWAFLVTAPLLGAVICWAFLQTLPRDDALGWSLVVRAITALIVIVVVMPWLALLDEVADINWRDDIIPSLCFFGLLNDWRCFISADRYPRVGLVRTLLASGLLVTLVMIFDGRDHEGISAGVLGAAIIVSVQILAPYVHVRPKQTKQPDSQTDQESVISGHRDSDEIHETRTDTDSFLLQENN